MLLMSFTSTRPLVLFTRAVEGRRRLAVAACAVGEWLDDIRIREYSPG